jgi:hypothetical protein
MQTLSRLAGGQAGSRTSSRRPSMSLGPCRRRSRGEVLRWIGGLRVGATGCPGRNFGCRGSTSCTSCLDGPAVTRDHGQTIEGPLAASQLLRMPDGGVVPPQSRRTPPTSPPTTRTSSPNNIPAAKRAAGWISAEQAAVGVEGCVAKPLTSRYPTRSQRAGWIKVRYSRTPTPWSSASSGRRAD